MKDKIFVYVPNDAKVNLENSTNDPPKTEYEYRKRILSRKHAYTALGMSHAIKRESEE